MGGCYGDYSGSYGGSTRASPRVMEEDYTKSSRKFLKSGDLSELIQAYKSFFDSKNKGFFAELAKAAGIKTTEEIPKEFPGMEYEVKFDLQPEGSGKEPGIEAYLNAFDFPPTSGARFLKDPVNNISEGINSFLGEGAEEQLVVIRKAGNIYLKEKSGFQPVKVGVQFEEVVLKRTEDRYMASVEDLVSKIGTVVKKGGNYSGEIRKEKGDAFVLDTSDGRIYSFTITRAHLFKPGEKSESAVQRQLELEYAGYIPGFKSHEVNSEKQLVQGMVDLAKYVYVLYREMPLGKDWRIHLVPTTERKYDFIRGKGKELGEPAVRLLTEGFALSELGDKAKKAGKRNGH